MKIFLLIYKCQQTQPTRIIYSLEKISFRVTYPNTTRMKKLIWIGPKLWLHTYLKIILKRIIVDS